MAPARVRGCVRPYAPPGRRYWQADASRRRSGPRKATYCRPITGRLRSKPCPAGWSDATRAGRRAEGRSTALDMAFAKLESRLRRSGDRRKCRNAGHGSRPAGAAGRPPDEAGPPGEDELAGDWPAEAEASADGAADDDDLIAIPME